MLEQANAAGATLQFNDISVNIGPFAQRFLGNVVDTLQSYTSKLNNLANAIDEPLINQSSAQSLTIDNLLTVLGYGNVAQEAESLAVNVHNINSFAKELDTLINQNDNWIDLGSFQANVSTGSIGPVSFAAATDLQASLEPLTDWLHANPIEGLTLNLVDPAQLMRFVTGVTPTTPLFSYTYGFNFTTGADAFDVRLASIPISPETATELDIDLIGSFTASGSVTVGYDGTGFQSGNLAQGFFVSGAKVNASVDIGLAGTINEAELVGYRLTGEVVGTVSGSVAGPIRGDTLASTPLAITDSVKTELVTSTLGPDQMLGEFANQLKTLSTDVSNKVQAYMNTKGPVAEAAVSQTLSNAASGLSAAAKSGWPAVMSSRRRNRICRTCTSLPRRTRSPSFKRPKSAPTRSPPL